MAFDEAYFSIGQLDRLSYGNTFVHRLDPRVKVVGAMLFILTVVSYPKYEVISLVPFLLFPVLLIALADIPFRYLIRKVLLVAPFAVFIGIFNPVFDSGTVSIFGMTLSAGWISFGSILLKFTLTISMALILIATTSFPGVCHALRRLGVPALFVSQLLFLYRYLFVLMEEAMRIVRARDMRSFGNRGMEPKVVGRILGVLFLRTVERAERIYDAMLSRGFRGEIQSMKHYAIRFADIAFMLGVIAALVLFRFIPVPAVIGRFLGGLFG